MLLAFQPEVGPKLDQPLLPRVLLPERVPTTPTLPFERQPLRQHLKENAALLEVAKQWPVPLHEPDHS